MSGARFRRRVAWLVLLLAVCVAHWWVAGQMPDSHFGEGAADEVPEAINVAFVRELAPAAPPVFAPPPVQVAVGTAAKPAQAAASAAAAEAASAPASAPEPAASGPTVVAVAASAPEPLASSPSSPSAASAPTVPPDPALAAASAPPLPPGPVVAASAPPNPNATTFDWPPSTQLNYTLFGDYRGPLHGTAKVEWLRDGSHYQVRLGVTVAFVVSRRMLSDGFIGPNGLSPRRYDEVTEIPMRETRQQTVLFEPSRILLANGRSNDVLPGVQDTASQFVQMTYLFLTKPDLLQVGRSVEFPLALPRRVGQWTYDVAEQVDLPLPFGEIKTFHLVPRLTSKRGNEMVVETWIAPSLQYLPVKILIRQDGESFVELTLKSPPLQAAPATAASSPARIVR